MYLNAQTSYVFQTHMCYELLQFAQDHVKLMLKHIILYQIICETYAERQVHCLQRKSYERFFYDRDYLSNLIWNDKMWPNFMFIAANIRIHDHHLQNAERPTCCSCSAHLLMPFKIRNTKWSLKQCVIMSKLPSKIFNWRNSFGKVCWKRAKSSNNHMKTTLKNQRFQCNERT